MNGLTLATEPAAGLGVLCLGAHADDIEIGCGGTMLRLLASRPGLRVRWVVFSAAGDREREARAAAELFLRRAADWQVVTHQFRDGYFPHAGGQIKDVFEALKREVAPDIVFTHFRDDRHQDHRVISDLTWNTFRDHLVLEYEIPKYDGDLGTPNFFVPLDAKASRTKARHLVAAFGSQRDKHWFSEETFLGLMRLRGLECRAPGGYAEAFHARKLLFR